MTAVQLFFFFFFADEAFTYARQAAGHCLILTATDRPTTSHDPAVDATLAAEWLFVPTREVAIRV